MQASLAPLYPWLKAGHVIFMVFWMAGLFMLPRQLIYVHPAPAGSEEEMRWVHRMGLLRKVILTPSLVVVWLLGLLMAWELGLFAGTAGLGWLHAKLLLVVLLVGYHHVCGAQLRRFARGENVRGHVFYRWFNEVPVLFLLGIVILVVVKPF